VHTRLYRVETAVMKTQMMSKATLSVRVKLDERR
jgi:hypothetical protein